MQPGFFRRSRHIVQWLSSSYSRSDSLRSLASPESYSLTILLELSDELITLLHNVIVLLVLVVWPIRLDDAFASYTIDGTWDTFSRNEFGEIAVVESQQTTTVLH